jgi:peptidyl-prolyl cis-trans isomerase SurA
MAKPADGKASVRFDLKRIRINIRNFQDQGEIARKLVVADNLRNRFSHCDAIKNLVDGIDGAAVKDVGKKTSEQFPMPLKSLLIATDAGKMTPPQITSGGIEVYAVCQRQDIASNNKQRAEVKSRLRQQEFQLLARRHLRDLRQDAFVEYK